MTDKTTGPGIFTRSLAEYDAAFSLSDDGDPCTPQLLSSLVSATQAHVAATVMLAEITANAANVGHYDLDAWRHAAPAEQPWTTVTFEVDGETVKHGEPGEVWEVSYRVPQFVYDDENTTEGTAEQYSRPTYRRLARNPEPKHELLPVGTRVLVSDPHDRDCGCSNAQPYVGKIAGYDLHKSKYQINEERYGTPDEYYNFVRWTFADNRVQPHPEQPATKATPACLYVEDTSSGYQGYIERPFFGEGEPEVLVRWFVTGTPVEEMPVSKLKFITIADLQPAARELAGNDTSEPDSLLASLLSHFERKWSCDVQRSGLHNGADCMPDDPHDQRCRYVWEFPLLTDAGAREIGITTTEDTQ